MKVIVTAPGSPASWSTLTRSALLALGVAIGILTGAAASYADHWPRDLWESLDRERS
jgi:hypothetical protein